MSKEEFLKIQTCDLKVNIHCDGCKQKVKKLLQKIDGVYTTSIDAERGKVTVSGNVDPATLIKKLAKHGKHAELWPSKGAINPQFNFPNQFPKVHLDNGKVHQKDNGKPQKGGGGGGGDGGKDQKIQQQHPPPPQLQQQQQAQQLNQQQQQLLQQMKGFNGMNLPNLKDMKLPLTMMKDPKSVKFTLPPEDEGSDYDDEYDDDEYDDDDLDDLEGFEDFEDDLKHIKMKPPMSIPAAIPPKKGDANINNGGKKGDQVVQGQNKSDGKNNGKKNGGTVPVQDGKNVGNGNKQGPQNNNINNNNNNSNGGAIGGKKGGGGKPEGHHPGPAMNQQRPNMMMMNNAFQGMNLGQQMGQMGQIHGGAAMAMPHMGNAGHMANVGGNAAVQGLPAGGMPPEVIAAANPYQQQYMAAMMQQRMMHGGEGGGYDPRMYPPMGYARPMAPGMAYFAPPPPTGGEYTHFFSDENTNSCSIM